jgi:hypothetical protein
MNKSLDKEKVDGGNLRPKKPYRAPDLIRWGDLSEITQTAGKSSSTPDGGWRDRNKQTS